jgi:Tfp pilus assembly PilM family ATPase
MDKDPDKDIMMKLSAILPSPASSVGPIHCAGCGAKNPAQRKYCSKCGNHLWDPCINCGETNPAQGEFCGNCGANLKEALEIKKSDLKRDISRARKLLDKCLFLNAISLLKPITAVTHSRLKPAVKRAKDLIAQCQDVQMEWMPRIHKIEAEIQQLVSADKIDQAIQRANEIPEALRSQETRSLLENTLSLQAEISSLSKDIAQIGEKTLTLDLVRKVERLLALKSDHPEGLKQAQAIIRGAIRKAKRLANVGDYGKSLDIVELVPKIFYNDEFSDFREQISSLAYMAWDIEHAPFVDKTLIEFARRLYKLVPDDAEIKVSCKKLVSREKDIQSIISAARRWSEFPSTPVLGAPTEFFKDLGPVVIGQNVDTTALVENPGRFVIACGLALQGLDLVPLQINLLPEESWIGKIGHWLPKRKAESVWGIEISSSGIKAVKLKADPAKDHGNSGSGQTTVILQECRIIEHRRRLNQSANDTDRDSVLDETLQKFLTQYPMGDEPVILGLPDWMVLLKTVELPPIPTAKRDKAIANEARHLFPTPLPDVLWKHARFDTAKDIETQKHPFTVAFVGVRQMLLKDKIARWQKLGLKIASVQCDMLALYNFAMFHNYSIQTHNPIVMVDLGADRLNILSCSSKQIWHRSVMFGSDRINKALVRELKLTHGTAEQWKCNPTLAPCVGKYYETLQSVFEDYVQDTLNSIAAYQKAFPDENIGRIICCGGGFAAHDLPRYFLWRR